MKVTKKLLAILLGLTLVLSMGISVGTTAAETDTAENVNLLKNGDFESVSFAEGSKKGDATYWNEVNSNATAVYVTDAHTGTYAYSTDKSDPYIEQYVSTVGGAQYRLTYWFKVKAASNDSNPKVKSKVWIRFFEKTPTSSTTAISDAIGYFTVEGVYQSISDGWKKIVAYVTTPTDAAGMSVRLYASSKNSSGTAKYGACVYDDLELTSVTETVDVLGFTASTPVDGSCTPNVAFPAADLENAILMVKSTVPATAVTNGTTIYASAYAPKTASAVLMYGLYSMDANGNRVLKSVKLAYPDTNGILSVGMEVPVEGTYTLEAFTLENLEELSPMADKIILQ